MYKYEQCQYINKNGTWLSIHQFLEIICKVRKQYMRWDVVSVLLFQVGLTILPTVGIIGRGYFIQITTDKFTSPYWISILRTMNLI
jgi:hypothetical protein